MTSLSIDHKPATATPLHNQEREFLTFSVADQQFGIEVRKVRDVLKNRRLARIPLAPPEIAGALNLRGRIITAIDVRRRLQLPDRVESKRSMSVVVEHDGDVYNLIVDSVGEVLKLADSRFEPNPATLDARWQEFSEGIYRLDGFLLVVLKVDRLLALDGLAR